MKLNFLKLPSIILLGLLWVTVSCSDDQVTTQEELTSELPKAVLNKIEDLEMNPSMFDYREVKLFDGSIRKTVITANDIAIDLDRFLKIPTSKDGLNTKQYRTEFLVDTNQFTTIDIYAFVGDGSFGLSAAAQQGLVQAVENWNSVIASRLKLTVTFGTEPTFDPNIFEIVVNAVPNLGRSGLAQFPFSDGRPGSFAVIDAGFNTSFANFPDAHEHLMTHELGHTIGFRHTDWNSRQTCVDLGIEPAPSVEANSPMLIFGTLPSIPGIIEQEDSIMNACFAIDITDGELNVFDEQGLRELYPKY